MENGAVQVGAVLAGRYRIDRVLGQGGMGIVVQAMHLQLHQPVAIKFLLPEVLGNREIVQRFVREAQAAVRLRSEHVARVIDVGTFETGAPYMVLEYLEGADLSNFPRGQLTVGGIIDLVLQACEALAEAHSLGIIHRDIKPANFFITRRADGTPLLKVLDFGISKLQAADTQLTATQSVMGTPAYMSPEQMRSSRDVDQRSDIWALGIVLYELFQGAPPFGGDTFSSMVIKVVTEQIPRLTVALPRDLDSTIYRCLEKDPARRFQNIAELTHALARYASSPTQAAISVQRTSGVTGGALPSWSRARSEQGAGPSTISGAARGVTQPSGGGRRWPLFAVSGLGIAALAAAVFLSRAEDSPDISPMTRGTAKTEPSPSPPVIEPATSTTVAVPKSRVPDAVLSIPEATEASETLPREPESEPPTELPRKAKKKAAKGRAASTKGDASATESASAAEDILDTRN